jgi:2-keto-4-pentenoate hydratase
MQRASRSLHCQRSRKKVRSCCSDRRHPVQSRTERELGQDRAATNRIFALAERQWRDYRAREPGTCFSDSGFSVDLADAYALQDAVALLRTGAGDHVIGYKVGCTGVGTVQQFGMAGPIRGCLFESEIQEHGVAIDFHTFANLAIEGEMAVRIGSGGAIDAVFPVIELHHFVFRRIPKTLPELVANNGLNGGFVLPDKLWLTSREYVEKSGVLSVRINGEQIAFGELWPMPGGAEASLDWLCGHLAEFGHRLHPGQIVLAGTPLGLYPVRPGDRVTVLVDGRVGTKCAIL